VGIGIFLAARAARRRWGRAPATDIESLPSDDAPPLA